jgi:hypothetical protein
LAGKGKTPAAMTICMSLSRYIIEKLGLEGVKPGFRRAKQIDGLRETPGEQHIPIMIDDINLDSIHPEDLKSLLTVAEQRLIDCRYSPLKLEANEPTILLNNKFHAESEPGDGIWPTITFKEFMAMVETTFNTTMMVHIMAILKRAIVMIIGKRAIYLRLPGEEEDVVIHRISVGNVHNDLLETNKAFYGKQLKGIHQKYDQYDNQVEVEQALVRKWLADPLEAAEIQAQETADRHRQEWGDEPTVAAGPMPPAASSLASSSSDLGPPAPLPHQGCMTPRIETSSNAMSDKVSPDPKRSRIFIDLSSDEEESPHLPSTAFQFVKVKREIPDQDHDNSQKSMQYGDDEDDEHGVTDE